MIRSHDWLIQLHTTICSIRGSRDSRFSTLTLAMNESEWKLKERTVGNLFISTFLLMSSTKCPSCGMGFANKSSVLKHMNHQFSSCNSFFLHGNPLPTDPNILPRTPLTPDNPMAHLTTFPDAGFVYSCGDGYMGDISRGHTCSWMLVKPVLSISIKRGMGSCVLPVTVWPFYEMHWRISVIESGMLRFVWHTI